MTCACAGCGKHTDCGWFGLDMSPTWLGYACGCSEAFIRSGKDYKQVAQWARERRAGRAA